MCTRTLLLAALWGAATAVPGAARADEPTKARRGPHPAPGEWTGSVRADEDHPAGRHDQGDEPPRLRSARPTASRTSRKARSRSTRTPGRTRRPSTGSTSRPQCVQPALANLGIYTLNGDSAHGLQRRPRGNDRPTEFKAERRGTTATVRPESQARPPTPPRPRGGDLTGDLARLQGPLDDQGGGPQKNVTVVLNDQGDAATLGCSRRPDGTSVEIFEGGGQDRRERPGRFRAIDFVKIFRRPREGRRPPTWAIYKV